MFVNRLTNTTVWYCSESCLVPIAFYLSFIVLPLIISLTDAYISLDWVQVLNCCYWLIWCFFYLGSWWFSLICVLKILVSVWITCFVPHSVPKPLSICLSDLLLYSVKWILHMVLQYPGILCSCYFSFCVEYKPCCIMVKADVLSWMNLWTN